MLPADFNDEQRARFAHEHPNDLDSSPSSPSSGTPTFFDTRRRPKSAARHHSHTATDGSSSSHLLARLISSEEEVREINAALAVTSERLEAESSRANAAERRALDYFHRLRIATENRERAEQESARLREELKLYKLQLENAQKEIFRAQDIIDQVASQRNEAEAEAARARTKARKLQEEKLVMLAREEGRRMGYKEGLSMGRRVAFDEDYDGDENYPELGEPMTDDERNDPRPHAPLRSVASMRQHPMRSESAPPVRTLDTTLQAPPLPIPSREVPVGFHTPSAEHRTPSPPRDPDGPETIHPIPIRPSPIIPAQPINAPPLDDGWIPRADSRTSYIHVPPPHELQRTPSTLAIELQDGRRTPKAEPEPMPVPPPSVRSRDHAYRMPVPPPVPHGHTPSVVSHASSHLSHYDLVNKRPGSSLRQEIYAARAKSGSQHSRESMSRNEHRESERRHSSRTEAESIAEQWRTDDDVASQPRNPLRSHTPAAIPHPYRPPNFYYRPRDVVTPAPPEDVDDPRSRTPIPAEPTAPPEPLEDDPESLPARTRSPLDYLRKRFRQRPGSGSSSIPNIVVESPSEPETAISPSGTIAAQPELLSPEAANRPLPRDVYEEQQQQQQPQQPQHYHHHHRRQPSHSQSQPQPAARHDHHASSSYDAGERSGTPYPPWPAGFIPYAPGNGTASKSGPGTGPGASGGVEKDRRRTPAPVPQSRNTPTPGPNAHAHPYSYSYSGSGSDADRYPSQNGYVRTRMQSASTPVGRVGSGGGAYEAAPLPPGVSYPAPPVHPHMSHRRHREREVNRDQDWDRDRDKDRNLGRDSRDRDRVRDVGDWERERERAWDRDRDRERERRRDLERDYERERGRYGEDSELDEELMRSPAPLQRPISLFDSDEA